MASENPSSLAPRMARTVRSFLMVQISRILCPVDFSEFSRRALEHEQVALGDFDKTTRYSLPEYLQSFERVAMKLLKAAVPPDAYAWCTPEERVASGKPYRAIIQVAEETGADLIVMGVHGEGVLDRWLFGSTTHHRDSGSRLPRAHAARLTEGG